MTKNLQNKQKGLTFATRAVAYTGIMTALVYVCTLLGISTPQFYFNLGDSIILITAALFNPVIAMIAGGLGAFFADLTVYPATMLFTLLIKAIEGLVAGCLIKMVEYLIKKNTEKQGKELKPKETKKINVIRIVCCSCSMLFASGLMMTGYFVCQKFFYGTINAAIIALPMDAVQASVSTVLATLIVYVAHLEKFKTRLKLSTPFKKNKSVPTENVDLENNITPKTDTEIESDTDEHYKNDD